MVHILETEWIAVMPSESDRQISNASQGECVQMGDMCDVPVQRLHTVRWHGQ